MNVKEADAEFLQQTHRNRDKDVNSGVGNSVSNIFLSMDWKTFFMLFYIIYIITFKGSANKVTPPCFSAEDKYSC